MEQNGWHILFHKVFNEQFSGLVGEVARLKKILPDRYKSHPKTLLLKKVYDAIVDDVPTNPFDKKFLLGHTLGKQYAHWRRVKNGLPKRHRLFFQADTGGCFRIIFAWLNVEAFLRKAGDKNDVYKVFRRLLDSGEIPDTFSELLVDARPPAS